jgi:hypothetical protein
MGRPRKFTDEQRNAVIRLGLDGTNRTLLSHRRISAKLQEEFGWDVGHSAINKILSEELARRSIAKVQGKTTEQSNTIPLPQTATNPPPFERKLPPIPFPPTMEALDDILETEMTKIMAPKPFSPRGKTTTITDNLLMENAENRDSIIGELDALLLSKKFGPQQFQQMASVLIAECIKTNQISAAVSMCAQIVKVFEVSVAQEQKDILKVQYCTIDPGEQKDMVAQAPYLFDTAMAFMKRGCFSLADLESMITSAALHIEHKIYREEIFKR